MSSPYFPVVKLLAFLAYFSKMQLSHQKQTKSELFHYKKIKSLFIVNSYIFIK